MARQSKLVNFCIARGEPWELHFRIGDGQGGYLPWTNLSVVCHWRNAIEEKVIDFANDGTIEQVTLDANGDHQRLYLSSADAYELPAGKYTYSVWVADSANNNDRFEYIHGIVEILETPYQP